MAIATTKALAALRELASLGLPMETAVHDVVETLKGVVPFETWSMAALDEAHQPIDLFVSDDVRVEVLARYAERWFNRDEAQSHPTQIELQTLPALQVMRISDVCPRLAETEIYEEIYSHHRHAVVAGVALYGPGRPIGNLGLGRPPGSRDYSDRELSLLRQARPYLVQALSRRPARSAEVCASGVDETAFLVCDAEGRIEHRSTGAWRLLRWAAGTPADPAVLNDAANVWARPVLARLARRVAAGLAAKEAPPAEERCVSRYGRFHLRAFVLESDDAAAARRFAVQIERRTPTALRMFASPRVRGLTGREQAVCRWLMEGLSQGEIAERIGVRPSTVASQARSLYARLGVTRREELAGAVFSSVAGKNRRADTP